MAEGESRISIIVEGPRGYLRWKIAENKDRTRAEKYWPHRRWSRAYFWNYEGAKNIFVTWARSPNKPPPPTFIFTPATLVFHYTCLFYIPGSRIWYGNVCPLLISMRNWLGCFTKISFDKNTYWTIIAKLIQQWFTLTKLYNINL